MTRVTPPAQKGRWGYTTTDLRTLQSCGRCGVVIPGTHRAQHNKWHEYIEQLAGQLAQPELPLEPDPNTLPPPF